MKRKTKGQLWRKARLRNLWSEIRITRKAIKFNQLLGATQNVERLKREMISLKSKVADLKAQG